MSHELDTMAIEIIARGKKARAVSLWGLPEPIKKILCILGLLPLSNSQRITKIIKKSLETKTYNGLISLERQGCTIEFINLPISIQETVRDFSHGQKNGMQPLLKKIVLNIPQS